MQISNCHLIGTYSVFPLMWLHVCFLGKKCIRSEIFESNWKCKLRKILKVFKSQICLKKLSYGRGWNVPERKPENFKTYWENMQYAKTDFFWCYCKTANLKTYYLHTVVIFYRSICQWWIPGGKKYLYKGLKNPVSIARAWYLQGQTSTNVFE